MIRDIQEALSRLASVFRRRTLDQDFEEEFASHIDLLTEQNEGRGLPHDEARRQAILQIGGLNATKDLHREARGLPWFERFLDVLKVFGHDLIHAVRSLAKARSFTFVCVASLGIGMGTVIGFLILLRMFGPPAGFKPDGLVELLVTPQGRLRSEAGGGPSEFWSYPDYSDVRNADTGLTITGWTVDDSVFRTPKGGAQRVPTMYVSANYFSTMGVSLKRGAGFDAGVDEDSAARPVVIIDEDFWNNTLGSDPDILGKAITLNRIPHVVVGIIPDGFHGHMNNDEAPWANLWIPLRQHPRLQADNSLRFNRAIDWVRIHGRLSPGISIESANAAVAGIMSGLASVEPYLAVGARSRGNFSRIRTRFFGMAGLVLLIVCLNISGMMLVRTAMRERELSVRQAIGATQGQLIRYLFSEALVLATLAGSLASGLLVGVPALAMRLLSREPIPPEFKPDAPMFAICVGLCLVTSLLFGLMPALRFSRPSLVAALKDDVGGGGRQVGRVHRLAAAIQVGLAVPFLVAGGVLLDHVRETATAELGFQPHGFLAAPLHLKGVADSDERAMLLLRNAKENLAGTKGITSVGLADALPLDFQSRVWPVSRLDGETDEKTPVLVRPTRVDEGYLTTMGIRLVRGRGFTAQDGPWTELVAVLTGPAAARLFPNSDPLGERITFTLEDKTTKVVKIVGVITDVVGSQMSIPRERAQMLIPISQHPTSSVFVLARMADGSGPLTELTPAFREAFRDLNPDYNLSSIITGEKLIKDSRDDMFGQFGLTVLAGGVALTLAALGVYGVIGFMVAMRQREIAVRLALGASRERVLGTILTDVVKLVAPGVVLGLIVASYMVRNSFLSWYSLGGVEFLSYAVAAAIAVGVAVLAGLGTARRAARVEPVVAMRAE